MDAQRQRFTSATSSLCRARLARRAQAFSGAANDHERGGDGDGGNGGNDGNDDNDDNDGGAEAAEAADEAEELERQVVCCGVGVVATALSVEGLHQSLRSARLFGLKVLEV
jgi:hypothetical protein